MIIPKLYVKINFKSLFLLGLFGALLLMFGAYFGFMLVPNIMKDKVWEKKVLREGTDQWNIFMKMPFMLDFKVYLFNIQNPEEVLTGAKPVVKEMGPYVYKLQRWKNQVEWNYLSDEISYYEYEKYEFDQNGSGILTEDDLITVLNIPYNSFLLTAESLVPDLLSLLDVNLHEIFGENDGLFLKTKVKDFLFNGIKLCENGAHEKGIATKAICSQIKNKAKDSKQMRVNKNNDVLFANFHFKNNTHQGYFTIKSGQNIKNETAKLVYFDNKTHISAWLDEKSSCNKIGGVTAVFPANVDSTMSFESFSEDICRSMKMEFADFEMVEDIKGYRFVALNTTFNNSVSVKNNECFCINKTMNLDGNFGCLFDGVSDLTNCKAILTRMLHIHFLIATFSLLGIIIRVPILTTDPVFRVNHEKLITILQNIGLFQDLLINPPNFKDYKIR